MSTKLIYTARALVVVIGFTTGFLPPVLLTQPPAPEPTPIVVVEGSAGVGSSTDEPVCENTVQAAYSTETDSPTVNENGERGLVVAKPFGRDDCFIYPDGEIVPVVPNGSSLTDEALERWNAEVVDGGYFTSNAEPIVTVKGEVGVGAEPIS